MTSVFPHPILFGVFCSMMVANFFYVFYERTRTRFARTLLAVGDDLHVALDRPGRCRRWSS